MLDLTRLFSVDTLDTAIRISQVLNGFYVGVNTLYKNIETNTYMLFLRKSDHSPEEFNKVCNILSEYAVPEKYSPAVEAYFEEHHKLIIKNSALQHLAEI